MVAELPGDIGFMKAPLCEEILAGPPVITQNKNITKKRSAKKPISFQISSIS